MANYRPSVVTNIRLKFDEAVLAAATGIDPQTVQDTVNNPPSGTTKLQPDPALLNPGGSGVSWLMALIPKKLTWEKPGYRQAGHFTAAFNFKNLPIDPITIRAAAIEIHSGAVSDADYAAGMTNPNLAGRQRAVLQTRDDNGDLNLTTQRMVAVVDEWTLESDDGGIEVTLEGRDLRGILLDTMIAPEGLGTNGVPVTTAQVLNLLDLSQDIQSVVRQLLTFNPFFQAFKVVANPADWSDGELPIPGAGPAMARHRRGARGNRAGGIASTRGSSARASFWDVIVSVCYLVGGIPYFIGTSLCIRPASTVYDKLRGPIDRFTNPTPFAGGNPRVIDKQTRTVLDQPLRVRRMVFGRDILSIHRSRKLGGKKRPKLVRCVAIDQCSARAGVEKQVLGFWPPQDATAANVTRRSPGKEISMTEIENISAPAGIVDPKQLALIARAYYEELGRSEVGGEIVTKSLASFGGDNDDPDLCTLDVGDGVELIVDTRKGDTGAVLSNDYTDFNRLSFEDMVSKIAVITGDRDLATAIVASSRGQTGELQRFFLVENIKGMWDITNGLKLHFDFQNYIVVRSQVDDASSLAVQVVTAMTPTKGGGGPGGRPPGTSLRSL